MLVVGKCVGWFVQRPKWLHQRILFIIMMMIMTIGDRRQYLLKYYILTMTIVTGSDAGDNGDNVC